MKLRRNIFGMAIIWKLSMLLYIFSTVLLSCSDKKNKDSITEEQALTIATEIAPKIMADQEENVQRIINLLDLIAQNAIQSEYTTTKSGRFNMARYIEPKQHKSYTNEYDFSHILFLLCNDKDALLTPKPGKRYHADNLSDYDLNNYNNYDVSKMHWTLDLNSENAIIKELVYKLKNYSHQEIEKAKQISRNAICETISRIERFDKVVFIHLVDYMSPTLGDDYLGQEELHFYGGQMKCRAEVYDIATGKMVARIDYQNANSSDLNFYYTEKKGSVVENHNAKIRSMEKTMHDNLINTMKWRLQELLVKRGVASKRKEDKNS